MIIFANDQSYSNFAVVVFKDGEVVDRKVFHTGSDNKSNKDKRFGEYFKTVQEQLIYMKGEYFKLFDQYKPDKLIFEGLAFGAKGDRVFQLGGLFYYITSSLCEEGLVSPEDIITITPKEVKAKAREDLEEVDYYMRDGEGSVVYLKSKKPKLNPMKEKKWIKKALMNTPDSWILDGYTTASKLKPTGAHDIPDAYYIGKVYLNR
ncbi:putative resolvase [Vibrio phage 496E54-1]|nr:putative resolvase [Vibrio phage 496E54-1]